MAPVNGVQTVLELIEKYTKNNNVMIFSKSTCPYCDKAKQLLKSLQIQFMFLDLDKEENGKEIQDALFKKSGQKTVPNVFIKGKHFGGWDDTFQAHQEGKLMELVATHNFEYDLVVIGGGSGGLAVSKRAADLGRKVAVCDFVKPSPSGTTWGLGGTCVNVGCIPKKLMHQAALLGRGIHDAEKFGWKLNKSDSETSTNEITVDWEKLVNGVQDYIGSLNWGYRVALREKKVNYVNGYAEFIDAHTVETTNKRGKKTTLTSDKFVIAVGERPKYPAIPGAMEFGISSDDLFSLPYNPGKTLVVGASYVALECAGFLRGIGLDVTVMVRSILLRGFDQQIAEKIGNYMKFEGVKFIRPCVPTKIELIKAKRDDQAGLYKVTGMSKEEEVVDEYNTILFAIGRESVTKTIGLEKVGITTAKNTGKIQTNEFDQTSVPNIYCIGDNAEGKPELTPVAIQAGRLLARRLYSDSKLKCDYSGVPTTVFTPLEYSCCGLSEEDALEKYGDEDVEVYHSNFGPLEWTVAQHDSNTCYMKVICLISENERVIGIHFLGPNAGEVMQGFATAMKCGMTKAQLDATIGIHPTNAEVLTTLPITKRSKLDIDQAGC